jgi:hypothetical protein
MQLPVYFMILMVALKEVGIYQIREIQELLLYTVCGDDGSAFNVLPKHYRWNTLLCHSFIYLHLFFTAQLSITEHLVKVFQSQSRTSK